MVGDAEEKRDGRGMLLDGRCGVPADGGEGFVGSDNHRRIADFRAMFHMVGRAPLIPSAGACLWKIRG
jgi:hypothetical protein